MVTFMSDVGYRFSMENDQRTEYVRTDSTDYSLSPGLHSLDANRKTGTTLSPFLKHY